MRYLKLYLLPFFSFALIAQCVGRSGAEDYVLFGVTIRQGTDVSPAASCASEIAVTTTQMDLVEDGDVTRSYSTTSPFYTDVDSDGGTSWGFKNMETCVYLVNAFNGTVEIPITTNSTYSGRLNVKTSFPVAASGNWPGSNQNLPAKLVFTGNGTTGHGPTSRQCFTMAVIQNVAQNPKESPFTVSLGEITNADDAGIYKGKNPCDVSASVEDDEGPGVRVSSISRVMEEPGGTGFTNAQFLVHLRTAPSSSVVIPINDTYDSTNSSHREGIASPTSLTFTTGNWNVDQAVTVTSQDDLEVDGTKTYTVQVAAASSGDSSYNGFKPRDVIVINNDKSVPGYTYTLFDTSTGSTNSSTGATVNGFATDEMNNMSWTYSNFNIKLRSKPSANVTLNFSTSNPAISNLITTSLTFTPANWNVDQTVYVTGKSNGTDGASGNGNLDYTISFTTTTGDSTYSSIPKPTFVMRSCDNDNTHLIQPCNFSGQPYGDSRGRLSGAEPSSTTNMWLITKSSPGSTVTVGLTSTDTTEGTVPANVTIDSTNYNALGGGSNKIVLSHVDDTALDGTITWDVTTALSTGGLSYNTADVNAQTTDNEQRYYINVTGTTKENTPGQTATIDVCLGATNANSVTINAACVGTAECGSVSPANVTFTPGQTISGANPTNASCSSDANKKTFTVTGADDSYADGTQSYNVSLTVTTTDPIYTGNDPGNQGVSNQDDELPGHAVFVYSTAVVGEMTLSGIGGADNYCANNKPAYAPAGTYKALMVSDDASNRRIATTDGSTSAGQVGWVLTPNNYYYRCSGSGAANCSDQYTRLFIANSAGLIPFPMSLDFSTTGTDVFWSGMNGNMTAATQSSTPAQNAGDPSYRDNCAGWTYQNAPVNPFPTYYANTWTKNSTGTITVATNVACTSTQKIICVQQ